MRAERAAVEERRSLLLREMNHRIKNLLATVQAIANQTFKDRATPDSLRAFGSRLAAMAAAHDLLVTENWESSDLQADGRRGAGAVRRRPEFGIEGPRVRITARAAVSLSMALHELCTNAAKYGALGVPAGQVAVRWWLEEGESGRAVPLHLDRERRAAGRGAGPAGLRNQADRDGARQRGVGDVEAGVRPLGAKLQPRRRRRHGARRPVAAAGERRLNLVVQESWSCGVNRLQSV